MRWILAQCDAITSGESTLREGIRDTYFAFQTNSVSSYNLRIQFHGLLCWSSSLP